MSLELCILGSGSSGNCSVLRTPNGVMLIDSGLGPRIVAKRLCGTGVSSKDVRAICLTHLDRDHFSPIWLATIVQRKIRVHCHSQRMNDLLRVATNGDAYHEHRATFKRLIAPFGRTEFEPIDGVRFSAIPLAHDRIGSHGFVIEGFGQRVGYATDLGRVSDELIERFSEDELHVLALESNYDPQMQTESSRPWFLKRRIMGGCGHLSNEQAFEAIRKVLDRCERQSRRLPEHIVLLHRSRRCNCPKLVRKLFTQDARVAARLTIADQFERSPWLRARALRARAGEQLMFEFSGSVS